MSTYRLNKKSKHVASALLDEVATFIATQEHGSLGAFDTFGPSAIPPQLVDEKAVKNGFSFIELADGSRVALLNVGAVVLLESEGSHRTLANSLEEFLLLWSKGESGVSDLDDGEALGVLAKWVKAKKLKAPKVKRFDFTRGSTAARPKCRGWWRRSAGPRPPSRSSGRRCSNWCAWWAVAPTTRSSWRG